jgi:hypothetical protein
MVSSQTEKIRKIEIESLWSVRTQTTVIEAASLKNLTGLRAKKLLSHFFKKSVMDKLFNSYLIIEIAQHSGPG